MTMVWAENIREFIRVALVDGPLPVQDLQQKARAAGLLPPDMPISQCKSFRTAGTKLGVRRFQSARRWLWELPKVNHMTPGAARVPTQDGAPVPVETSERSTLSEMTMPDDISTSDATAAPSPDARSASDTTAALAPDRAVASDAVPNAVPYGRPASETSNRDWQPVVLSAGDMREFMAEARIAVAKYLASGDLADLFPNRGTSPQPEATVGN
jgi:hypothetical protein